MDIVVTKFEWRTVKILQRESGRRDRVPNNPMIIMVSSLSIMLITSTWLILYFTKVKFGSKLAVPYLLARPPFGRRPEIKRPLTAYLTATYGIFDHTKKTQCLYLATKCLFPDLWIAAL